MVNKFLSGSWEKKSRFRDEKNNPIAIFDYIYFPLTVFTYLLNKFNLNLNLPIINFKAIKIFKKILNKQCVVLEFGSGRSTVFFSNCSKKVISYEDNEHWFRIVKNLIKQKKSPILIIDFVLDIITLDHL